MPKEISSEELDLDPESALHAAQSETIFVIESGKPAFVIVSNAEYEQLTGQKTVLPDATPAELNRRD